MQELMDWPEWIGKSGSTQTRCNPCASSIYPERLNLTKNEHVMKWKAGHYAEEAPSIYRGDSDVFAQWSVDRFNGLCCGPFKMKNENRIHNWGVICTIISVLLLLLFSSWLCQLYLFLFFRILMFSLHLKYSINSSVFIFRLNPILYGQRLLYVALW